ncbi:hypothetical protein JNM87_06545 [Candidatus Saccharibacteria bacterium]|nr:hypothetical protein [Candidatus Saccharibacteria bacterium]
MSNAAIKVCSYSTVNTYTGSRVHIERTCQVNTVVVHASADADEATSVKTAKRDAKVAGYPVPPHQTHKLRREVNIESKLPVYESKV